ncbi:MAG TPA: hypothetical protein VMZ69_01195, partial [Saprospiraceae bacterium]|nr:hypothetical protein [Saprospiraceae bacterium]
IAFLVLFLIKCIVDWMVLMTTSRFFNVQMKPLEFIPLQFIYLLYVLIMGWNLLLGKRGDWI